MTEEPAEMAPQSTVVSTSEEKPAEETKPYVRQIFLIEYKESTLHSLEEFAKLSGDARTERKDLDDMVLNIARTGQVCYAWDLVKTYLAFKIEIILKKFFNDKGFKPNNKTDKYEPRYEDLFVQLLDFPAPPFTVQRLCEIIVHPDHYTETNSILFGLEKMVSVSTVQKTLTPAEVERVNSVLSAAMTNEPPAETHTEDASESMTPQSPPSDSETKMV